MHVSAIDTLNIPNTQWKEIRDNFSGLQPVFLYLKKSCTAKKVALDLACFFTWIFVESKAKEIEYSNGCIAPLQR